MQSPVLATIWMSVRPSRADSALWQNYGINAWLYFHSTPAIQRTRADTCAKLILTKLVYRLSDERFTADNMGHMFITFHEIIFELA